MVVSDFLVIDYLFHFANLAAIMVEQICHGLLHIFRDVLAVRSRVCHQLFFVQFLYDLQSLTGGKTIIAVSFSLQGR